MLNSCKNKSQDAVVNPVKVEKIEYAIEQHPSFLKVIPAEEIEEQERLNKLREWNVDNKEIP